MPQKKILVIEDEPTLRILISDLLEAESYEPVCAEDGMMGLELARSIQPDLILCDVMLPGMDGYSILDALQKDVTTASVPFIFLTALSDRLDVRRGMALGADDYITKPFDRRDLVTTIRTRLKKYESLHYVPQEDISHTIQGDRLLNALNRAEFVVYYQPQLHLQTQQLIGAEALLRWCDPERGLIPPTEFIPIAETTGAIIPIGLWVLQEVCQQAVRWQKQGLPPLQLAVNLSSAQFDDTQLTANIAALLKKTGLDPQYLDLELTESLLVKNVEATIHKLDELKALGLNISVDDFGTGYASLGYLQHFSFDTLKLDRCFVQDVHLNPKNAAIVMALIQMSHSLGLEVIAEGVETFSEQEFLMKNQCDAMQGFLFSRPLPVSQFEDFIKHSMKI